MTDDLHDLFAQRADRAHPPTDPERLAETLAGLAETRTRHHRNRLAVASGAAVLVAAATVGIAVADPGGGTHPTAPNQAAPNRAGAGPQPVVVTSGNLATILPHYSALDGKATVHGARVSTHPNLEQTLARAARKRAERLARRRASGTKLVPAAPAPAKAEISLGLVPKGFQYLDHDSANTYYGPAGLPPGDYFSDGIVVDVHQFSGSSKDYTLTVRGKPASYITSDGYTIVRVRYSKRIDVGFQAPPAAHLTEPQALRMARTLDVRSTKHTTKG